jgi:hypothetical protein
MSHLTLANLLGAATLFSWSCGSPPKTVAGRWEFADATNLLGQPGNPSNMQITLMFTGFRADSVFGKAYVALDAEAKDDRECAVVRGARTGRAGLNLIIFTVDDSSMDMMFEGKFRGDSLLMTSVRPRSGKNVLPWGSWLVFVRTSSDTITGCLTSA